MRKIKHFFIKLFLASWMCFMLAGPAHAQKSATNYEATITEILHETTIQNPGEDSPHIVQKLQLLLTSGDKSGTSIELENGNLPLTNDTRYVVGDRVVVYNEPGTDHYQIADLVRRPGLVWLFVIFVIAALIVGRLQGVTSLLGLVASFLIIFYYVLPRIVAGGNPLTIVIIGSLVIIPIIFCLAHGFNKVTLVAIAGTVLAMIVTGILIYVFTTVCHLTGLASEEAGFLAAMYPNFFNMTHLLMAGMLFATLGVLDDVTISQAAIVEQLYLTDPGLGIWPLYRQAMRLGRDHIASMINTLILVYAGASFPLLLLFTDSHEDLLLVLNYELLADEIVRTLTGSIGLIIAVPLTTILACIIVVGGKPPRQKHDTTLPATLLGK